VAPGLVVAALAVLAMVSPGTSTFTTAVHRGSVLPAAQLLRTAVDTTVLVIRLSPGSGSRTTTE
jgi:hypothetical protein